MKPTRITVIVPSYNQGQYLEDTFRSLFGQEYPDLELLVYDGGSTDQSVEIIKKYSDRIAFWRSEKDAGQSSAINEGMRRSTGQILCWLNSDDMHMPGTLAHVANRLQPDAAQLVFGNSLYYLEGSSYTRGSDVTQDHATRRLLLADYLIQPSCFWTRKAWEVTGELDPSLIYGFDWNWFVRAQNSGVEFLPTDQYLSIYRAHKEHKTGTGGSRRTAELAALYGQQAGKKYEELFVRCSQQSRQIARARGWLQRLRLGHRETVFLKGIFPQIFVGHTTKDISDVLSMI